MTRFYFVRHGESEKNLTDITGGRGAQLTPRGQEQARHVALQLSQVIADVVVVACPTEQTVETGRIISETLGCAMTVDERLEGAGMGVLTGLRQSEVEERFPGYARQLRAWRARQIEACDLQIEGMEPPFAFWRRIWRALEEHRGREVIVVATRSLMVFASNVTAGNSPRPGGGYRHVDVSHGEAIVLEMQARNG